MDKERRRRGKSKIYSRDKRKSGVKEGRRVGRLKESGERRRGGGV